MLASCTKLLTTICVLQLIEKGELSLDQDIESYVPALAEQQIIVGLSATGEPKLVRRTAPLTLRSLLTHSSGLTYDFISPEIQEWKKANGVPIFSGATLEERFAHPLSFEPGQGWAYGPSIDWAGRIVEVVSGLSLEAYVTTHICEPLGVSFTFDANAVAATRMAMSIRDADTGKVVPSLGPDLNAGVTDCLGGQGVYGTPGAFMAVLRSLLLDDGILLRPETAGRMFTPQLTTPSKHKLLQVVKDPSLMIGDFPVTEEYDWGLGGILIDGEAHPNRRKGTLIWSGVANVFWVS